MQYLHSDNELQSAEQFWCKWNWSVFILDLRRHLEVCLQHLSIATHFFSSVHCSYCTTSTEFKIPHRQKSQGNYISKLDFRTLFFKVLNFVIFQMCKLIIPLFQYEGNGDLSELEERPEKQWINYLFYFVGKAWFWITDHWGLSTTP